MSATSTAPAVGAIDFTVPPELADLLGRIRAFIQEDVLPAEAEITDPNDLLTSWHVVDRLRDRARELGIYTPHLPEEWGGLGIGVLGMSLISQECGVSGLASLGLNAMAPDEGNMHTLLIAGDDEQKERFLLRHDRAGRRLVGPHEPRDDRRPRRRQLGPQRPQVVHHRS